MVRNSLILQNGQLYFMFDTQTSGRNKGTIINKLGLVIKFIFYLQSKRETVLLEFISIKTEIVTAINNLDDWMRPEYVKKNLMNMINSIYIEPEPFGVVCVFSAWNYPVTVLLQPMVAAVAAGVYLFVYVCCLCVCLCVLACLCKCMHV